MLKINEKLQARPRPLRPDLQRPRLVRRRPQRQGRDALAGQRPRQGLLTRPRPPSRRPPPRLHTALKPGEQSFSANRRKDRQRNHARTCAHLSMAATAAPRRQPLPVSEPGPAHDHRPRSRLPGAPLPRRRLQRRRAGLRRHGPRRRLQLPRRPRGHRPRRRALRLQGRLRPRRRRPSALKAGGYWPHNLEPRASPTTSRRSSSSTPTPAAPTAMVGGNYLTAARTAAASAVSIKHLARQDAKVLGMIGAGHQSAFQLRAALRQRAFERVIGWNLHPEMLSRLADTAAGGRPAVRGRRPRPPRRGGRRHHHHHLVLRPDPEGRPGQARHASRLHGHRHQGQAGGRGRAPRRAPPSSPTRSPSRSRSARPSTPSPPA